MLHHLLPFCFVFSLGMYKFSPSLVVYMISNLTGDISLGPGGTQHTERDLSEPSFPQLQCHELLGVCRVPILGLLPLLWPDYWWILPAGCAMSWQGSPQCRIRLSANWDISRLLSTEAADPQLVKPSSETENTILLLFSASAKGFLLSLFV